VKNEENFQLLQIISHPQTKAIDKVDIHPGNFFSYTLRVVDSAGHKSDYSDTVTVGLPQIIWDSLKIYNKQSTKIPFSEFLFDPDNNPEDLLINLSNESNISIRISSNDLILTPDPVEFEGMVSFSVRAEDPQGFWDIQDIQLEVLSTANQPPQITSSPPGEIFAGEFYRYQIAVSDPDSGDSLSLFLETAPYFLQLDENERLLSGQTSDSDTGSYQISILLTDMVANIDRQQYILLVKPQEIPPYIINLPENIIFAEDDSLKLDLNKFCPESILIDNQYGWSFSAGDHLNYKHDVQHELLTIFSEANWSGSSSFTFKLSNSNGLTDERQLIAHVTPRVDLIEVWIGMINSQIMRVDISTDMSSILEMSFWIEPNLITTYKSNIFDLKHSFYLNNLYADTTYYYSLILTDTSGYPISFQGFSFSTIDSESNIQYYKEIVVYPNPFRPSRGHNYLYFDNLPEDVANLSIYALSGDIIFEKEFSSFTQRRLPWNAKNKNGIELASGFYIYLLQGVDGQKIRSGKFAIIR
jgi:hypothetical protein